jgi:hypothetical protein
MSTIATDGTGFITNTTGPHRTLTAAAGDARSRSVA